MKLLGYIILTWLAFVLYGCAQETMPSGGIKDEFPPEPISITPSPLLTGFQAKQFTYVFDEYIQVDDFNGQLLVSPPLKKKAEYLHRGKSLTVSWQDTLLENTTYQFNLGEAVKDFNEGNINDGLIYVFSTGDYIDSTSVRGSVFDAETNEPVEKAKVMLYQTWSDTLPYTTPPDYLALTNAKGEFTAQYLPPDTFMIFVLFEESSNYKYDGPPEKIGFLNSTVVSAYRDSLTRFKVPLFLESDTAQYIKESSGKDFGYFEIVFNLPVTSPSIRFVEEEEEVGLQVELEALNLLSAGGDTLRSWVKIGDRPELEEVIVYYSDSTGYADTLSWFIETDPKYREEAKLKPSASISGGKINRDKPVYIDFNHPLEKADTTLIHLIEDSTEAPLLSAKLTRLQRRLEVQYPFKRETKYLLWAEAGAFEDIYGNYSDSLGFAFSPHEEDHYGSLTVNVIMDDTLTDRSFVATLYDAKESPIRTFVITQSRELDFGKLDPAKYTLKGFFDENGNEEWDTGNYKEGIQPERKAFFTEELNVRSNWDLDVDWIPTTPLDGVPKGSGE